MSQGTVFPNFSGLREDLADVISIVDNKNTPVTSTARKGADITNPGVFSWQADEYKDPSFDGILTNADVSTFDDASSTRALLSGRAMKFRRAIKTDDFTQISDIAGIGKNKSFAHAVSKSLVELKRDIESAVCSDRDSQEQASTSSLPHPRSRQLDQQQRADGPPGSCRVPHAGRQHQRDRHWFSHRDRSAGRVAVDVPSHRHHELHDARLWSRTEACLHWLHPFRGWN
jgi:hypothetical protein